MSPHLHRAVQLWLTKLGFHLLNHEESGFVFLRNEDDTCLIVDTIICDLTHYPYVSYTSKQNELMHNHQRVFRVLFDQKTSIKDFQLEVKVCLDGDDDPETIRRFGRNRTEQEPDPTLPEATFEDCFLEAFGDRARMALHREFAYIDILGITRYIDYALFGTGAKFAFELNGETFHHPVMIGAKRYRSQLLKQNSLVYDGFKVYRWSLKGMRDRERFILELSRFTGDARPFIDKSIFKLKRTVQTFSLFYHQEQSLTNLAKARKSGQNAFLLVLPTGTGKTEIFIEDIARLKKKQPSLKSLIIVPSRKLREQTINRLSTQSQSSITTDLLNGTHADCIVQTTAYLHRHYYKIPSGRFDYIVVDEAHHAPAQGLRNILTHFTPTHLLGVTATPDRTDQQSLVEIFGEYEPQLSLEDAIKQNLVPPVRCYRVQSNIDLSEVRFNGREYVKNDLQTTLLIPSRDKFIAKIITRYFGGTFTNKQGIVFCVNIEHAKRMATILNTEGIPATAVSGRDLSESKKAQQAYDNGDIRFLCACDLLTEGWDAPQTAIIIMARPTFSKVLYTQQLGRGLRNFEGKEALYVIDVVDNYGARLQPMSLHALFKIPTYQPFENLIDPYGQSHTGEIVTLDGLYEGERRIEPVDIFSFEEKYGSFLNEEQLARELFISTGTVKQWLRSARISSDAQYPFGTRTLHFFDPDKTQQIRKNNGLQKHTAATRATDFDTFLEKRDYAFSYKIVFLLGFLKICNERFEASLPDLVSLYQHFYQNILDQNTKNERQRSPYNRADFIRDENAVQRSLLANPFEKFERKRFIYHCKDLNYLAMAPELIQHIQGDVLETVISQMTKDLIDYYNNLGIELHKTDYGFLLPDQQDLFQDSPKNEEKYTTSLPYYPLSIAAGDFMDSNIPIEPESWFQVDGLTTKGVLNTSMFVAQVQGKSMEPLIPDGAYCLFTFEVAGSRNGKIVLAQKSDIADQDTGASYTVKSYSSTKVNSSDGNWHHTNITLSPLNPDYNEIIIPEEDAEDFKIIAIFEEVLAPSIS